MMVHLVGGVSWRGRMARRWHTFLPTKIVILMEMRKKEIGGRRAGTEERDLFRPRM